MPPANAQRPSPAQSQGPALRLPRNRCLRMESFRLILPKPQGCRPGTWSYKHLYGGTPWSRPQSRPRKHHQTTPSSIPATDDLKLTTSNFEADTPAPEGKRVLFVGGRWRGERKRTPPTMVRKGLYATFQLSRKLDVRRVKSQILFFVCFGVCFVFYRTRKIS